MKNCCACINKKANVASSADIKGKVNISKEISKMEKTIESLQKELQSLKNTVGTAEANLAAKKSMAMVVPLGTGSTFKSGQILI